MEVRSNRNRLLANSAGVAMGPKQVEGADPDPVRNGQVNLIDRRDEPLWPPTPIDWESFCRKRSRQFVSTTGRPAVPTRLMFILPFLEHGCALGDEGVVARGLESS